MPTNKKFVVAAFLLGSLIAGCGHPSDSDRSTEDTYNQALAYAKCMRENGVPNYPDPELQDGGVQVKAPKETAAMAAALEACRDKQPQRDAGDNGGSVDAEQLAKWMRCMRAKLPQFPDADVSGGTVTIELKGTGIAGDSAEFDKARKACQPDFPDASLNVVNTP